MNTIILTIILLLSVSTASVSGYDQLNYNNLNYCFPLGINRTADSIKPDKIIGRYGENRNSNVEGHKHAGIDIKADFNETVYSIGKGVVTHVFRDFPHKTVYILHNSNSHSHFYSVYIHLEDIKVNPGDPVDEHSPIGRIFNREELERADFGTPPHLHFEIRHNIEDKGDATFNSMTIQELERYCMDPLLFFKRIMNENQKLVDQVHKLAGVISVETQKVELVSKVRSGISKLIAQGIDIENRTPRYRFTKLNDIKPDMLREAAKNARIAANEFAENAGVKVGGIRDAQQGGFYIRDAGEEYGDTAKIEKDVRVVTTITFYLTE